ncbi:hypothetical protein Syun_008606 [Stephania yunnanensis]|uniref:Uncharacterized protein n=1 Tax=Stephania yunnanensis TaxID=152371 RepID=A0AAP0KD63_9MAGN
MVVLMAAKVSRLENQDAIHSAIVSMLADPREVLYRLIDNSLYVGLLSSSMKNTLYYH